MLGDRYQKISNEYGKLQVTKPSPEAKPMDSSLIAVKLLKKHCHICIACTADVNVSLTLL